MGGDYTRFTFDPAKVFSGVHKQQGRVSLDSDFNEFEEILDRHTRSEMFDTVGQAVVPKTTPTGFEIAVAAGKLTIGIGRAYVDGIQAECFGDMSDPTKTVRDDNIGGVVGPGPVAFDKQPFFYQPNYPSLSTTPGAYDLVYLDVWQREVTVFEDAALREPALNGPDTATRVQTAWQVKVLHGADASSCDSPPAAWNDLIAPSTARLTAGTKPVPPAPGPCVINPAGGYTGIENRLYRVEIQKAGTLGGATKAQFKWSRDNASLAASVLSVAPAPGGHSVITVASTGRDSWMRFEHDQTIELLDDDIELAMRETGVGGRMMKVVSVNHATGEIEVDTDVTVAPVFTVVPARHPRIRRWDVATTEPAVRDVNNGTAIPLEEGITVTFGPTDTDTLHAGDYWVFAARTADGSIQQLVDAPPRGILHHFAKLAVVQVGAAGAPKDCRVFWPPTVTGGDGCCDCTVCVTEESHASGTMTIQKAVDTVIQAGGGTVCIDVGKYPLDRGVVISEAVSLHMHGVGAKTILWHEGPDPALTVEQSLDVVVENLTVVTYRDDDVQRNAIELADSVGVALDRVIAVEDARTLLGSVTGEGLGRRLGAAVSLDGLLVKTAITNCLLGGGVGVGALALLDPERSKSLVTADLAIERSVLFATGYGVQLGADPEGAPAFILHLDHTRLARNSIYGCRVAGADLRGRVLYGHVVVEENAVATGGYGIVVGTDNTTVSANLLNSSTRPDRHGIVLARGTSDILRDCQVIGNRVLSYGGNGVLIDADVVNVMIKQNMVRRCGGGILMTPTSSATQLSVANNDVSDIVTRSAFEAGTVFGILLFRADGSEVVDNLVRGIGFGDEGSELRAGIQAVACPSLRIAGNEVVELGPAEFRGETVGIGVAHTYARVDVLDNRVHRSDDPELATGDWLALKIGAFGDDMWSQYLVKTEAGSYWLGKYAVYDINIVAGGESELSELTGIRGNVFQTTGPALTVLVEGNGHCVFAENRCVHLTPIKDGYYVQIRAQSLALSSNHVLGPPVHGYAVFAHVPLTKYKVPAITAVGNITAARIKVNNATLGAPWAPLNIIVP